MMDAFGERQQGLLKILFKAKAGLAVDEIATRLKITRPATRQHLVALERLGYIERGKLVSTGGRPSQIYRLAQKGEDLFPKQYSWFSGALLGTLKAELGTTGLNKLMDRLGKEVASQVSDQVQGKTLPERVNQAAKLMNDLAYQAEATFTGREQPGEPPIIEAKNCVYHGLASQYPEVCSFDLSLLTNLTGAKVVHEKCILWGGNSCQFRFVKEEEKKKKK